MTMEFLAQGTEGGGAAHRRGHRHVSRRSDRRCGAGVDRLSASDPQITWLNDLAEWTGRKFKRPGWVALPTALFITTIISALFGFIWDVSLHIGKGRDPGPLANPAHYFILFGLFLLFVAGCLACMLPYEKPGPYAVRITTNWYAPVGGIADGRAAGCTH